MPEFSAAISMFLSPWSQEKCVSNPRRKQPVRNRVSNVGVCWLYILSDIDSLFPSHATYSEVDLFFFFLGVVSDIVFCSCWTAIQAYWYGAASFSAGKSSVGSLRCPIAWLAAVQAAQNIWNNECYRGRFVLGDVDIGVDCSIMSATLNWRTTTGQE